MRISDWSSDVCSSDLPPSGTGRHKPPAGLARYDRRLQGEPMADTADITALLDAARDGDRGALDRVLATLYQELHSMARRQLAGQHGQTLRSEEHTSELQSLMRISYAVFCLKKKKKNT